MTKTGHVGRMAPTPSGQLHLGNVCAFASAWLSARSKGGEILLRVEDIDTTRARRDVEDDQRRELEWLGLVWDRETPRQSERDYGEALQSLQSLTYRCGCTRAQIRATGGVYQGTCRKRGLTQGALRFRVPEGTVTFYDDRWGPRQEDPSRFGDPVFQRKDGIISYNLAVVVDDMRDGVTEVVRGADLLDYSALQARIWSSLGGTPPRWMHSPLIVSVDGSKLSKSHASLHIGALREAGWEPVHIWKLVFAWLGITEASSLEEAVPLFRPKAGCLGPLVLNLDSSVPSPGEGIRWEEKPGFA